MKHKITLIIIIGTILTSLIYFYTRNLNQNTNILSLGDGVSRGMTPYHIEGYNYNDYLLETLENENKINKYYQGFNEVDETTKSLIFKLDQNFKNNEKITINQAIKKSNIIIIFLGMDELNNYASKNILTNSVINNYINNYKTIINKITKIKNAKIYILSLYKTKYLTQTKLTYANTLLKEMASNLKLTYIDIENITETKEYFSFNNNYYPNYKGQEYIYNKISNKILQDL